MMGIRLRLVDKTIEERHNPDGSTDWRWQFEGAMSGAISCRHEPRGDGTAVTTTFDYDVPLRLDRRAADRMYLEKRMCRDFEGSMDNLRLLAETSGVPATTAAA